jgi:uncharacterized coiled-coil DUF342 family protein
MNITRKEELQQQIKHIADEMDSLEEELQDYQEQINKLYAEYDNFVEELP